MAVVSKDISAKLRLTDAHNKSLATFSGVNPAADPADISDFSLAVSALRNEPVAAIYLTVDSELTEEEKEPVD